jgi:hypothetical protein
VAGTRNRPELFEYRGDELTQQALIDAVTAGYFTQAMAPPWSAPVESA